MSHVQSKVTLGQSEKLEDMCITLTDDDLRLSKNVLEAKKNELKTAGKGNAPKKADPLEAEHGKCYATGALSMDDPVSLVNLLWFSLTGGF